MEAVATVETAVQTIHTQDSWRQEFERIALQMREEARAAGIEDMSMEEIDAIIAECRQQMRSEQGS